MTDLLVTYSMFLVPEQSTALLFYIQFGWPDGGQFHHERQLCIFLEVWICLLPCVAVIVDLPKGTAKPSALEDDSFHVWGPNYITENCFVFNSPYVIALFWLHNNLGELKSATRNNRGICHKFTSFGGDIRVFVLNNCFQKFG